MRISYYEPDARLMQPEGELDEEKWPYLYCKLTEPIVSAGASRELLLEEADAFVRGHESDLGLTLGNEPPELYDLRGHLFVLLHHQRVLRRHLQTIDTTSGQGIHTGEAHA